MRALRAHSRGGPEVLVYEEAPRPCAVNGEVLVEVHAAAITFDELTWDETWTRDGIEHTPTILSHEFSGVVAELGHGAVGVTQGEEVYGMVPFDRDGAAAEFVSTPASQVARKPVNLSHVEAAALPLLALTAWQALVDHASLVAGARAGSRRGWRCRRIRDPAGRVARRRGHRDLGREGGICQKPWGASLVPKLRTPKLFICGNSRSRAFASSSGSRWAVPDRHLPPSLTRTPGFALMLRT
jgi:hypothetical protein